MKIKIAFLLILLVSAAVHTQERYVRPTDEAKLDRTFVTFRSKLIAAAERQDTKFILSVLDPDIKLSFGGHEGITHFKELWEPDKKNSKFWKEFLAVIRNGGHFVRDNGRRLSLFYAPYSFNGFPEDLDAFEYSVIFGNNVNLRSSPSPSGKVVARLSYNIVEPDREYALNDSDGEPEWVKVRTLGGKSGFVHRDYVRSPIDYRAGFEKKRGVWKMVVFIAGD